MKTGATIIPPLPSLRGEVFPWSKDTSMLYRAWILNHWYDTGRITAERRLVMAVASAYRHYAMQTQQKATRP